MTFAPRFDRPKIASKGKGRGGPPPRVQEAKANAGAGMPMSFPGPSKGLCLFDDITNVPDGGALVLENYVVGNSLTRVRRGKVSRNPQIEPCSAICVYNSGTNARAFAICGSTSQIIFDISSPGAAPIAIPDKFMPTDWSFIQFASAGGEFLIAIGYGNKRYYFNGTEWLSDFPITGDSLDNTRLKQVWVHGARQWFIEANSLNAWYLPVDNIGGEAKLFPVAGVFKHGGSLVAGTSWTVDASDTGIQSSCIMITSEGEVAVYEGTDPDSNFSLKGVYPIGKPCGGINCFMKTGGDVVVMTDDGLIAMSQVISLDAAALVNQSVSKNIRPIWSNLISRTDKNKWRMTRRDSEGYVIISVPAGSGSEATQLVANLQTGAWSVWTGWNVSQIAVYGNELIFCNPDGEFFSGEVGGNDNGQPYTATYIGPYRMVDMKRIFAKLMRTVMQSTIPFRPKVTALFDYSTVKPPNPPAMTALSGSLWDVAIWDVSTWGGGRKAQLHWQNAKGDGTAIAPCVQVTINQISEPEIDLIRSDFVIENGSIV